MSDYLPKIDEARGGRPWLGFGLVVSLVLACWVGTTVGQEENVPSLVPLPPPPLDEVVPHQDGAAGGTTGIGVAESSSTVASILEIKVGRGRFLTFPEDLAIPGKPAPFLAVGDPSVADFFQAGPRQVRVIGKRLGATDLSITTSAGRTYDYDLRVTGDLEFLGQELRRMFPDASLTLSQLREKIVVEGQARDSSEVTRIIQVIDSYIRAAQKVVILGQVRDVQNTTQAADPNAPATEEGEGDGRFQGPLAASGGFSVNTPSGLASGAMMPAIGTPPTTPGSLTANQIATNQVQVINLIRVPSSQQVLLKVRVAELNRTGFREIGADFLASIPQFGTLFGTQIGGSAFEPGRIGRTTFPYLANGTPKGDDPRNLLMGSDATMYGTFSRGQFNAVLSALRRNNLLKVLAEPNLVTLNGHQASFLAGGEYPVPVSSGFGGGGAGGGNIQVQFKEFGVRLAFLPIIEDNDTIRLTVDPEVSSIDRSLETTLVLGGSPVPGLNIRKSHTTVELKQGETLAIAGLMSLSVEGQTQRIPGLGDLPYIGAFFSNTTSNRVEKELVVLVTPYLIEPMRAGQVPALPGDEVDQPTDLEFFLMNRIEGRTGADSRATTNYDDPLHLVRPALVERKYLIGPSGYAK